MYIVHTPNGNKQKYPLSKLKHFDEKYPKFLIYYEVACLNTLDTSVIYDPKSIFLNYQYLSPKLGRFFF